MAHGAQRGSARGPAIGLRRAATSVLVAAALALGAAPARADPIVPIPVPVPQPSREYAPLDRPGPALRVSDAQIDSALDCTADVATSPKRPVLLIPGTTLTARENFSWNYERAFTARDRPYCALTLPDHAMTDIQVSAEYVVGAIRSMAERSGQDVAIVGFSQGGMIGRWALRFWPDTRDEVAEVIGIDPSNHGTLDAYPVCTGAGCAPAFWQQQTYSAFSTALNSRAETFAGIDYTQIYTPTDEVVFPNLGPAPSSSLSTGAGARRTISTFASAPVTSPSTSRWAASTPSGTDWSSTPSTTTGPRTRRGWTARCACSRSTRASTR